ncbi:aminotransferase class I/II-fold pyridoxal phosphate-dependent enzyme [Alkalilimnicola ehrlichii]|uniref:aminotransferase class I/II-fold pyridoxal phosphate-dependent enzyme n=1 Tax=Alkalilimnicola ehrlichii TaxID=351052 RepID=UPI001C6E9328|nr:aminotransferase class I/II-fold pyridoxal phosphate-dependent enzyme [Alkalilimnicola ehrlichii]
MNIAGKTVADIFEGIRREVHAGRLTAGQVLPPVRELASQLGVNRNTVAAAYRRLVAAKIAETQGRNGTVIRSLAGAGEQEGVSPGSPLADLAGGNPDPALLPDPLEALERRGYRPRLYGEPTIDPELEALARRCLGPNCRPDYAFTLAHGAVDAIERLLAAYLVATDKVAVEDPCFLGSINTLRAAGLEAIGVAVDAEGMQPDSLEAALAQGVQAVICTPRAHNPTGCSTSEARAGELRRILARYPHVLVIEDDHFALLAQTPFHSIVPPETVHWALVRSVSKVFGPDLRLAFVASDEETARRLGMRLAPGTTWVSHLLQTAVRALLESQTAMDRIRAAGRTYARRRGLLVTALATRVYRRWRPATV